MFWTREGRSLLWVWYLERPIQARYAEKVKRAGVQVQRTIAFDWSDRFRVHVPAPLGAIPDRHLDSQSAYWFPAPDMLFQPILPATATPRSWFRACFKVVLNIKRHWHELLRN
jgi:hypothetical protein